MKLGVFTPVLYNKPLDEALSFLANEGVQMAEIGVGAYPGNTHCNPDILLNNQSELEKFKGLFKKYNISISALSAHGNAVHPNSELAKGFDDDLTKAILLAEKLGLQNVNTFSGCPGDWEGAKYPNWVTCPWPEDYQKVLDYQWNDVLIPYWIEKAKFAKAHGVTKIGLEMHPGFCVYNPETLLKLRDSVDDVIGVNFDPSHLIWQGIDPAAAIKKLGKSIYHFHAKDTKIDAANTSVNGVLDTKHYSEELSRSWIFRCVGYGMNHEQWKDMMSALRLVGYDYAISIEHEDSLMSSEEGLRKAITFLKDVMIFDGLGEMWWA